MSFYLWTGAVLFLVSGLVFGAAWWRQDAPLASVWRTRSLYGGLITLSALGSLVVYELVGSREALQTQTPIQAIASGIAATLPDVPMSENPSSEQIEAMVSNLAAKLKAQPDDIKGWRMLARSYETLGRFDQAADAYRQLTRLEADNPDVWTNYAVVLGMGQGQTLVGAPEAALDQALALNPEHLEALALSGSAAMEKKDYQKAIVRWSRILDALPEGDPSRQSIKDNIDQARRLLADVKP